jgi:hypothetical protein
MAKANATSSAHTPGPWHTDSIGADRVWILDGEGNYLAEIVAKDECGFAAPTDQQHANARLMAAAPALLDAARGLYDLIDELREEGCDLFDDQAPLLEHCHAVLQKHETA